MKVLIVSYESWRDDTNGGNVLNNIFGTMKDVELAQIYCSEEYPNNSFCNSYFKISDSMIMRGKVIGQEHTLFEEYPTGKIKIKKKHFRHFKMLVREFLWDIRNWKNHNLNNYVKKNAPDLIFAPCYAIPHMLKLVNYIHSICNAPIVSYISDDNYSFTDSFSLSYFLYQQSVRKNMRIFFRNVKLTYTMTDEQKTEYSQLFGIKMKILRKPVDFNQNNVLFNKKDNVISFIYAGGAYLGRDKIIYLIARHLEEICLNSKLKIQFDVYTKAITEKYKKKIMKYNFCHIHQTVPYDDLLKLYGNSDIAIHAESFKKKYAKKTRLSFSTKITDCISSGCAIFAVGPISNAGISFLKKNQLAVCSTTEKDIFSSLRSCLDVEVRKSIVNKTKEYAIKHLNKTIIQSEVRKDFVSLTER